MYNLPCYNDICRYERENVLENNTYCGRLDRVIDESIEKCPYFTYPKICDTCKNAKVTVYETGTIDDIEYRCKLQNNKLMYDDINPHLIHPLDFPNCPIDRYELTES